MPDLAVVFPASTPVNVSVPMALRAATPANPSDHAWCHCNSDNGKGKRTMIEETCQ